MPCIEKLLLSGNEAVASAALDAGLSLGTGYPGTPSSEILEQFDQLGGHAQWAPNEKVALEVGIGVAIAGSRAIVTMKHVGLNVAADPFFTVAYMDVKGALVVVSADDPGMASSQNEQDNRNYARAAGVAMFEPSDSQEAYDFTLQAIAASEGGPASCGSPGSGPAGRRSPRRGPVRRRRTERLSRRRWRRSGTPTLR